MSTLAVNSVSLGNAENYPKQLHDQCLRANGITILAEGDTDWRGRPKTDWNKQNLKERMDESRWRCPGSVEYPTDDIDWTSKRQVPHMIEEIDWMSLKTHYWLDPEPPADIDQVQLTGLYTSPDNLDKAHSGASSTDQATIPRQAGLTGQCAAPENLPTYREDKVCSNTRAIRDIIDKIQGKIEEVGVIYLKACQTRRALYSDVARGKAKQRNSFHPYPAQKPTFDDVWPPLDPGTNAKGPPLNSPPLHSPPLDPDCPEKQAHTRPSIGQHPPRAKARGAKNSKVKGRQWKGLER